jgi:hypothetical protein
VEQNQRPPDGAMCAEHPDRLAHYVCARCGSFACLACFHPGVARCERCVRRDPAEAALPLAWERPDGTALARYLATLGSAFAPVRTAPAFARNDVGPARRFALLSVLPLAALAGVIPYTRTLLFRGDFAIQVIGKPTPSGSQIALDVAQAALLQVGLTAVSLAFLLFPFTSLVRAYAPGKQVAAARVLYYRAWLLPAAMLFFYLVVWASPAPAELADAASGAGGASSAAGGADGPPPPLAVTVALIVRMVAPVLLFVAMSATARIACGLGPFMAFVVVAIPIVLMMLSEAFVGLGVSKLLPPPAR